MEQVPVPEHPPLHPVKLLPDAGAAVRVTVVPEVYCAEQVVPQLMPDGLLVTVPLPVPVSVTVNAFVVGAPITMSTVWPS